MKIHCSQVRLLFLCMQHSKKKAGSTKWSCLHKISRHRYGADREKYYCTSKFVCINGIKEKVEIKEKDGGSLKVLQHEKKNIKLSFECDILIIKRALLDGHRDGHC